MAGRRRVDVYRVHSEPLRHIAGPLRGCYQAGQLPQHHEQKAGEGADSWSLGAVVRHLFPTAGRVEGQESKF